MLKTSEKMQCAMEMKGQYNVMNVQEKRKEMMNAGV